ncbi:hypothetical protein [Saccharothrix saharensis]|uniref:hypothetical protein n=1 Tax=Saccharothrix saharensis TaxID=571190 RepID=UPI00114E890F|nr:hypothetical protein [Saccharothrix saharensis]
MPVHPHADELGPLPHGWDYETIRQWRAAGRFPGDRNLVNGDDGQLRRIALGRALLRFRD